MKEDLDRIGRPFGEFIPGRNTTSPGAIDKQIELVKQLIIKGKTVTIPETLQDKKILDDRSGLDGKMKKKMERENRRKARQESK